MKELQAFWVQIFLISVLILYATALVCGINIPSANEPKINEIKDILLILISPQAFSSIINRALNDTKNKEARNETTDGATGRTDGL